VIKRELEEITESYSSALNDNGVMERKTIKYTSTLKVSVDKGKK
jgi:hypothetical protein